MSDQTENTSGTPNTQSEAQAGTAKGVSLTGERAGVLGFKAGMTQVYNKDGDLIPVTVIDLQPNVITQVKNKARDGYEAVQIGMSPKKAQRTVRAEKGHFKKSGAPGFYHVQEFRLASVEGLSEGSTILPDFVKEGELVDITGVSKGKGFQGGMKRYNMSGNYKTHGASLSHRSLGSIGNRADPAKTFKNKKMPGQMGKEQVTTQNLRVIGIDLENGLMLIKGSVPGPKNGLVTVRKAIKSIG
jgi:large subunit ribosomal protein L3